METITIAGYNPAGGYALDPPDQPWYEQRYPTPPAAGSAEDRRRTAQRDRLEADLRWQHDQTMWARQYGHLRGLTRGCPCGCDPAAHAPPIDRQE